MTLPLAIDPRDPLPLYAQLERGIKLAIASGALPVGAQLPTVRQLAVDLKINANTVAKVYSELERQDVLATRRGVGTFVTGPPAQAAQAPRRPTTHLRALAERFLAEAAGHGIAPHDLLHEIQRLVSKT
jgi:GntR family transcriptional regulator